MSEQLKPCSFTGFLASFARFSEQMRSVGINSQKEFDERLRKIKEWQNRRAKESGE